MSELDREIVDAERLAQWLVDPDSPVPTDLDPEVAEAVISLQPERLQAPELDLDALVASVRTGPFASMPMAASIAAPPDVPAPANRGRIAALVALVGTTGASLLAAAAVALVIGGQVMTDQVASEVSMSPDADGVAAAPVASSQDTGLEAAKAMKPAAKSTASRRSPRRPAASRAPRPAMAPPPAEARSRRVNSIPELEDYADDAVVTLDEESGSIGKGQSSGGLGVGGSFAKKAEQANADTGNARLDDLDDLDAGAAEPLEEAAADMPVAASKDSFGDAGMNKERLAEELSSTAARDRAPTKRKAGPSPGFDNEGEAPAAAPSTKNITEETGSEQKASVPTRGQIIDQLDGGDPSGALVAVNTALAAEPSANAKRRRLLELKIQILQALRRDADVAQVRAELDAM